MTEPINLNKTRKAAAKAKARSTASQNRVRFGRTKAARDGAKLETDKAARSLDLAKREH
ncbi:DUF4169 family protein [Phenylobacterium sp.]|uniref:DUF4169 family protein n=1 Tax=Phenylobacterium sp. TaxID=1871053 RepID=UPI003982E6E9